MLSTFHPQKSGIPSIRKCWCRFTKVS